MKKATRRVASRLVLKRARALKHVGGKNAPSKLEKPFFESRVKKKSVRGKVRESANELLLFHLSRGDSLIRSLVGSSLSLSLSFGKSVHTPSESGRMRKKGKIRLFRPRLTKTV